MNVPAQSTPGPRRITLLGLLAAALLLAGAAATAPAMAADFGLNNFDVKIVNEDGTPATQAGAHPFAVETRFGIGNTEVAPFEWDPNAEIKDTVFEQIEGLVGDVSSPPRCKLSDFVGSAFYTHCPLASQVGVVAPSIFLPFLWEPEPVFALPSPPGTPLRLGFPVLQVRIIVEVGVRQEQPYNVVAHQENIPQILSIFGAVLQLWGNPQSPAHDHFRRTDGGGGCNSGVGLFGGESENPAEVSFKPGAGSCPAEVTDPRPFLTNPTACGRPLTSTYMADSWQNPGAWIGGSSVTHDNAVPANPQGFTGCGKLGFAPRLESKTTTDKAETGTGLNVNVDFDDEGLTNSEGLAQSQAKKAVVTLPDGVTINPSIGEGLGVCTPADYAREALHSEPGEGCPNSSKVGTLHIDTPLVDEGIDGSVYLAEEDDPTTTEPGAENPFDSLIALYMVLRNTNLGAIVKLPLKVEPDPSTGRLVATLEDIPQFPFSHFNFHFKEGVRSALVTPATCGTYTTEAKFYPWSDPSNPRTVFSDFQITQGKGGGPCPPGGIPSFNPKFEAGSENNNAGSFSPFDMRITREDGEQDMTKFSATLPPGELGSLAGVAKCPDSAIADARSKTGKQEKASPSCPANSLIGHTLAGAGVGDSLTYVPGYVYLGGPWHGDPLSVIAITPALAGPFDAGTVVVQEALTLNPKTAEVEVDGANSDPIPHIVKGIVLKLRDLRVNIDRSNFTLNPTSCDESKAKSVLFGSYLNVLDPSDDRPVDLSTRYQAANCLNLGFKPDLKLNLKGGTRRGAHPGLRAIYTPRKADANIKGLVVRLPRSAFLDQSHIRTICTRVQFAAGGGNGEQCPKGARYGYVKAWTPLLDEPLQGPVYLRSSNHKLPDMVLALHGLVDVEVAIRIDSAHGGIRATMEDAPDALLSRVLLKMQGAKKGLIVNSRSLCAHTSRANVLASGHNGKRFHTHPVLRAQCGKARSKRHGGHRRRS